MGRRIRFVRRWGNRPALLLLSVFLLVGDIARAEEPPAEKPLSGPASFYRDIRPIFQAHCHGCHQPAKAGGGLDMTRHEALLDAWDSGLATITPAKPDESYLLEMITPVDGEASMPQGKKPLAENEIALVRRWIEEGAVDDTPQSARQVIDGEHPPIYRGPPVITSLDWSPGGELLAVAGYHEVLLHRPDGSGVVARLVGMSPRIESVRFSPDGSKLAVTGGRPAELGEVQIWDVAEAKLILSVSMTPDTIYGASWSPDGKRVAFGCADSSVRVIDVESGEQVLYQSAHDDWVLDTTFSVDGSHLASVGRDMAAKLIEVPTQRFIDNITSITPGALKGGIESVVRHPLRDEILFGGADGTPKIYKMHRTTARVIGDDANLLWELPSLPGRVFSVAITSDARVIAAGSSLDGHGTVRTYGMEPAPVIPDDVQAILHKPTHQRSAEEKARLTRHFEEGVKSLATIDVSEGGVFAVALSPDGTRVAAAGSDGVVRLFDASSGNRLGAFSPVEITPVEDSPDGETSQPEPARVASEEDSGDEPRLAGGAEIERLLIEPATMEIGRAADYVQVVVTAELAAGSMVDVTRQVSFEPSVPIVEVDRNGLITPRVNGEGVLKVALGNRSATIDLRIASLGEAEHPDFIQDVAPILARAGCNQGTCHGAQAGKNGFKLSLRGYDAIFDVRALADDLASRRVNVALPAESLMLLKSTASVPHEGGRVLEPGSKYYRTIARWIAEGAHLDLTSPRVAKIEVRPANPIIEQIGARQQVRVYATYADGAERDVTQEAFLESGNTDVVSTVADRPGLLLSLRRGEAPVLVRFEGQYAATTLTVMGDRKGFAWEPIDAKTPIDVFVNAKLERTKTLPSERCGDYEFVRRVYLDLTGLPPTPEELDTFLQDDRGADAKRGALIDQLIGSEPYIEYWTNKWADLLMVNRKYLGADGAAALRSWIRGELAANTPYDEFVRRILTASGSNRENPPASYFKTLRTPDALMENTTHLFLATRFNCNKCHDHPFERWTQDQYYQMAAFFAQVGLEKDPAAGNETIGGTLVEEGKPLYEIISDKSEGDVKHERTGQITAPAFPFECEHEVQEGATRREALAAWMTSADNPYFARSYVNRIWGYLTGRGIIEPLDDIRAGNPPSNPELLDYLTREFIESGFDTRHVVALICKSRTYQLSVKTNEWNEDDQINFSHARARRLPAEVLFDAIYQATGSTSLFPGVPLGMRAAALPDVGVELADGFLANLGRPVRESACECERNSNLQLGPVMALVSGPTVGDAISNPQNAIARLVSEISDDGALIEQLFLRFLNRPATPQEIDGARDMFRQVEADHQALLDQLAAYEKEISASLAKRELERQAEIVRLETELDVERELLKLRRPVEERERQARIDQVRAELGAYDAELAKKLPDWEGEQKFTPWRHVTPVEMGSTARIEFERGLEGVLHVTGPGGKDIYRVAAPLPLDRITGIRLEALADKRLPGQGPGRAPMGNFVVTEFTAELANQPTPGELLQSWDFSGSLESWEVEPGAKALPESGAIHLFGSNRRVGLRTKLSLPPGRYWVEIVTGVRPGAILALGWTSEKTPEFADAQSVRRQVTPSDGSQGIMALAIAADSPLTGLRLSLDGDESVMAIDAIRIYSDASPRRTPLALHRPQATFSQDSFPVAGAIDGDSTSSGNGWAISPQMGRDHLALFELREPLGGAKGRILEVALSQQYFDGQHSLGKFRISVTDAEPPLNLGPPRDVARAMAKAPDKRSDKERTAILDFFRQQDDGYKKLQAQLAEAERPLAEDETITALDAKLAKAREPLPIDAKLQQLRRAVALSESQLEDKRLTVAQDIAWAMINSPAFLYNH